MEIYSSTDVIKGLRAKQLSFFTLTDFARLFAIKNRQTLYKKIQRLEEKKIIQKLIKGKYRFLLGQADDFLMANFLYPPSYISLESALSFYGIITGFPYRITSVCLKKTKTVETNNLEFQYSRVVNRLFWGYEKKGSFLIADKEKALVDYFYFGLKGLRLLDLDEFELAAIEKKKLATYAKMAGQNIYDYIRTNRRLG